MLAKRKENSVRSLTNLYTVVIGVALSVAIATLINSEKGLSAVTIPSSLLFLAFIATLFPFYHGALRHLDDAYIENENAHIKDGALIIDFLLLFFHGIMFVLLSLLLNKPNHFGWVLVALFLIDVIWGVFTHFGSSSRTPASAEGRWTILNFAFLAVLGAYLYCNDIFLGSVLHPKKLSLLIAVGCVIRTLIDYVWCKSFYFPKE